MKCNRKGHPCQKLIFSTKTPKGRVNKAIRGGRTKPVLDSVRQCRAGGWFHAETQRGKECKRFRPLCPFPSVPAELSVEGREVDAEQFGRAGLVPPRVLERRQDVGALVLLEGDDRPLRIVRERANRLKLVREVLGQHPV